MRIPQDRPQVVEALRAERVPDDRVVFAVALHARERAPVRAGPAAAPRPADHRAPVAGAGPVHRTEGGSGEGHEQLGVFDDRGVHALAAPDAGSHQLPGVGPVEAGARWADGRPAVLAGDEDRALRQFARLPLQADTAQPDRSGAQPRLVDLGEDCSPVGARVHRRPRLTFARSANEAIASSSRQCVRILTGTAPSARRYPTPLLVGSSVEAE